jgi:hypothetical protein
MNPQILLRLPVMYKPTLISDAARRARKAIWEVAAHFCSRLRGRLRIGNLVIPWDEPVRTGSISDRGGAPIEFQLTPKCSAIRKLSPNPRRSGKLTRCSEPIRCGTEYSRIVYSVRIGPAQPFECHRPVQTLKASNCGISATIWPIGRVLKSSSRASLFPTPAYP